MKKARCLMVLVTLMIIYTMISCNKSTIDKKDRDRISFVKETLEGYELDLVNEVTQDTAEESGKDIEDVVSFGKHQIYEMSYLAIGDQELHSVFYHLFDESNEGMKEAEALYLQLKDNYKVLPEGEFSENLSLENGSRSYQTKYPLTNQDETSEANEIGESTFLYSTIDGEVMSIILIYNEEMNEVGIINEVLPTREDEELAQQVMMKLGW
jgi:hypothetical protein